MTTETTVGGAVALNSELGALLPCPFCGGHPSVRRRQDECLWSHAIVEWTGVRCMDCDVGFDWPAGAEPDAIMQWNTRAPNANSSAKPAD